MSSNNPPPFKKTSLAEMLISAANPPAILHRLAPIPAEEVAKFQDFYGLSASALWDLFLTGHIEDGKEIFYDLFQVTMDDHHFIAFCSGSFDEVPHGSEGLQQLTVSADDWTEDDHDEIGSFFESLDSIITEKNLSGIVLENMEDMYVLKVNNPYSLLKLIETYLIKHDVLTLDEIRPEDLKAKSKKITPAKVKELADTMRDAAQQIWDTDNYSVSSDEHIDIRYFPVLAVPTIDNADIALLEAQMVEEAVPFSLDLLKNTYRDCLGIEPTSGCGLALLH